MLISERRIANDEEWTSRMATAAAQEALDECGMKASELDLVLCCTVTGDQLFPATACEIGHNLGAPQAGGFDLSAACSGFVFGMQVAEQVSDAMSQLPKTQRRIIELAFLHDMPQREIAEELKLPLGTVKSRMRLAYGKLRGALKELG